MANELAITGPRTGSWVGHLPDTRAHLFTILERAVQGDSLFTLGERVFVTACEFWVLAMSRELHARSSLRAVGKLRFAGMAFYCIGAAAVAGELTAAHGELVRPQAPPQRRRRLQLLEHQLQVSEDPVDDLLARFADKLATADSILRPGRHGLQ